MIVVLVWIAVLAHIVNSVIDVVSAIIATQGSIVSLRNRSRVASTVRSGSVVFLAEKAYLRIFACLAITVFSKTLVLLAIMVTSNQAVAFTKNAI
jgi:hypothetical protein